MDLFQSVHNTFSHWTRAVFSGGARQPSTPFEQLSVEVVLLIASHLDKSDRLALRQTCKRLCSSIGSAVHSLPITSTLAQNLLSGSHSSTYGARLSSRFPQVRHLHCAATGNILRAFCSSSEAAFQQVSSIDIKCKSGLADSDLKLAAAACPNVTTLALDAFAFTHPMALVNSFTSLTNLSLRLMRRSSLLIWDDSLLENLAFLPNLLSFSLHADSLIGSAAITTISNLRTLHALHLHQVHCLTATDLKTLATMRRLQALTLAECSVSHSSHISNLATLPRLKSLHLQLQELPLPTSPPRPITYSSDFLTDLSAIPDLNELSLQGYLNIHPPSPHPPHLPHLASLTLRGPRNPLPSAPSPSPSSPSSSTSSAATTLSAAPPSPSPNPQLPAPLPDLCLFKGLRNLAVTHWYYLSKDILTILPSFDSLQSATVACLPELTFADLKDLCPMSALTALTLHTADNRLRPAEAARVGRLLGNSVRFQVVQEACRSGGVSRRAALL